MNPTRTRLPFITLALLAIALFGCADGKSAAPAQGNRTTDTSASAEEPTPDDTDTLEAETEEPDGPATVSEDTDEFLLWQYAGPFTALLELDTEAETLAGASGEISFANGTNLPIDVLECDPEKKRWYGRFWDPERPDAVATIEAGTNLHNSNWAIYIQTSIDLDTHTDIDSPRWVGGQGEGPDTKGKTSTWPGSIMYLNALTTEGELIAGQAAAIPLMTLIAEPEPEGDHETQQRIYKERLKPLSEELVKKGWALWYDKVEFTCP